MALKSLSNIKIGVCDVSLGGTDLGATKGGATITVDAEYSEMTVDQYGTSPVDFAVKGVKVKVEMNLAEAALDNIAAAMPHAVRANAKKLTFGRLAGYQIATLAKQLILHPQAMGADLAEDIVIYKAISLDPFELSFKIDEQRIYKVVLQGLVDSTRTNGALMGHFGDSTYV
jgi:hypothetical protein